MRSEDHTAAFHGRFADGAVPCAARALLPVRLGAATRDVAAGLGRSCALAGICHLAHEGLMHHRRVRLLAKDVLGQLDVALALAGGIEQRRLERILILLLLFALGGRGLGLGGCRCGGLCLRPGGGFGLRPGGGFGLRHGFLRGHQIFRPVGLPAGPLTFCGLVDSRTRTSAPFAPGTPPLSRRRLRSASTRTTL